MKKLIRHRLFCSKKKTLLLIFWLLTREGGFKEHFLKIVIDI